MYKSNNSDNIVDMSWLTEEVELVTVTKKSIKNSLTHKSVNTPNLNSSSDEIDAVLATVSFSLKKNLTSEQKKKMSEMAKNRPPASEETREKIKQAAARRREAGVKLPRATEERRQKISQAFQNRKAAGWEPRLRTPEEKARASQRTKDWWAKRKAAGLVPEVVSEETRAKIRQGLAKRRAEGFCFNSKEALAKSRATREANKAAGIKRKPVSEETREKMRQAHARRKASEYMPRPAAAESREKNRQEQTPSLGCISPRAGSSKCSESSKVAEVVQTKCPILGRKK
jgi:hypothetical protein